MPRKTVNNNSDTSTSESRRPALTPEARENNMINLAVNLAEKQLREGTASSQVITHYLKLASTREKLEQEKLELEKELLKVKRESIKAATNSQETYDNALRAFSTYSGKSDDEEYEEY